MSKLCDEMPIYQQSNGTYVVFHKDKAFENNNLELVIIAWGEMLKKDLGWSHATFIEKDLTKANQAVLNTRT